MGKMKEQAQRADEVEAKSPEFTDFAVGLIKDAETLRYQVIIVPFNHATGAKGASQVEFESDSFNLARASADKAFYKHNKLLRNNG